MIISLILIRFTKGIKNDIITKYKLFFFYQFSEPIR